MIIYGAGIGFITVAIRLWVPTEGISFAILLMNAFTPLINPIPHLNVREAVKHGYYNHHSGTCSFRSHQSAHCGLLLAQGTDDREPIASEAMKLQNAIRRWSCFDNDPVAEAYRWPVAAVTRCCLSARQGEELWASRSTATQQRFSGTSDHGGFDMEHHIVNYAVLQHGENPGLVKMTEWFRDATVPPSR